MKNNLAKLVNVKSIVTIVLTAVFAYLSIEGTLTGDQFLTIFSIVIAFYFGTQAQKAADAANNTEDKTWE